MHANSSRAVSEATLASKELQMSNLTLFALAICLLLHVHSVRSMYFYSYFKSQIRRSMVGDVNDESRKQLKFFLVIALDLIVYLAAISGTLTY